MDAILVTGGAGLIGSALCRRLLKDGCKVVAIDSMSWQNEEYLSDIINDSNFQLVKANILDTKLLDNLFRNSHFGMIYHLASNTSIPYGQSNLQVDLQNTFFTTLSILQMAVKYQVPKLAFASSSTIYGLSEDAFDEYSTVHPISYYGAAKLSCEAFISAFSSRYNIQTWIIRFCNVVGPDTTHGIISDIKKQIAEGHETIHLLGDGKQEKPFMYIDDAISGLLYVVKNATEKYNTFIVSSNDTITIRRLAEVAIKESGHKAQILFDNTPTWSGDVQQYRYDIRKIRKLGWQPKYNSEEAIRKSLK